MELLAPAGNMECLKVAIANGANAVYLGMEGFNARAGAGNFDKEDLKNATMYAHIFGVKVYVTTNTLIKSSEMDKVLEMIDYAVSCKVDAFLVQDFGLATLLRGRYPDIELHASTQMGVHNLEGAKFLEDLGFKRVVLSREMGINDIVNIRTNTKLEIEVFVQGALCVAFSGNCYLSSFADGSSGNRGRCKQLCRQEYEVNGHKKYYLSTSDICLLNYIDDLAKAGVTSLKIEGRMRRPAYVAQAVKTYRDALDNVGDTYLDMKNLSKIYSRGEYNSAYLFGKDVMNIDSNNHLGQEIGKVRKVEKFKQNLHKIYIESTLPIVKGDALKFLQNGKEVGSMGVGNVEDFAGQYVVYSINNVPVNAIVNKIVDVSLDNTLCYESKKNVSMHFIAEVGTCPILTIKCDDVETSVFGSNELEMARTMPITKEDILENLSKLNDTEFSLTHLDIDMGNVFIPKSVLNKLRRNAVTELKSILTSKDIVVRDDMYKMNMKSPKQENYVIMGSDKDIERICVDNAELDFSVVYEPREYNLMDIMNAYEMVSKRGKLFYLYLPIIAKYEDMALLNIIISKLPIDIGVVANNYYGLKYLGHRRVIAGTALNVLNRYTASALMNIGC